MPVAVLQKVSLQHAREAIAQGTIRGYCGMVTR